MKITITFRKRAAQEYLEAIAWYKERSIKAAENFIEEVNLVFDKIEKQPDYFRKSYKQFHEARLIKYPFCIVYFIDGEKGKVIITSIFHQKRNPKKKFR
jgi:plasmid stabilization system protein ParE